MLRKLEKTGVSWLLSGVPGPIGRILKATHMQKAPSQELMNMGGPSLELWWICKRQPNHDQNHFWVHLTGPHLSFWGYPRMMTHQMPFYTFLHSGPQRKRKDFSSDVSSNAVLMWHQMQNFLENYGCGCVWAVPEYGVVGSPKFSKLRQASPKFAWRRFWYTLEPARPRGPKDWKCRCRDATFKKSGSQYGMKIMIENICSIWAPI